MATLLEIGLGNAAGATVLALVAAAGTRLCRSSAVAFGLWTLSKRSRVTAQDLDRTNVTPQAEAEGALAASPALA